MFRAFGVLILCTWLGACASVASGTSQSVFVDTPMVDGASCKLTDSKSGSWYLASTPGSVTVLKGNGPMNVVCEKADHVTATATVDEDVAGAVFGNIILGGGIGILVDAATGAAQKYPDKIVVWMRPNEWKSPDHEVTWNNAKREYEEALRRELEKKKSECPEKPNGSKAIAMCGET